MATHEVHLDNDNEDWLRKKGPKKDSDSKKEKKDSKKASEDLVSKVAAKFVK